MIRTIIIGMACIIAIGEIHSVLGKLWPQEMLQDASAWFANPLPAGYITAGWWMYEVEGMFKYFMASALVVYLAKRFSTKLYYASLIMLCHSLFVLAMFLVYYKKPVEMFWVEGALIIGFVCCLFVKEKKQGLVKSMI